MQLKGQSILFAILLAPTSLLAQESQLGSWGNVIEMPAIPVSAANLPDGRVLTWSAYNRNTFEPTDQDFGRSYTSIFDPLTEQSDLTLVTNTQHDMFCPGTNVLPDGRIFVNGGNSAARTSIYDYLTNTWTAVDPMNIPRAYQGNTMLADGTVMTLGGSWSNGPECLVEDFVCVDKAAEVWTEGEGWRVLTGIPTNLLRTDDNAGLYRADNHMWLFSIEGGDVLHAGPSNNMNLLSTEGDGSVIPLGNRSDDADAMNGNAIMYDIGKLLTTGGAPDYDISPATNSAFVIETSIGAVNSRRTSSMNFPRVFHNSVVLPNGEVVIVGGQEVAIPFSDNDAIFATEIWNPETETFQVGAEMAVPRTYHSFALLLQDGRVLAGGGGLCGSCDTNHSDVEIYTPPYLYDTSGNLATRPTIVFAPDILSYGQQLTIETDSPITSMALVRSSAATHSLNNSQRRVPLNFTVSGNNQYVAQLPADSGLLTPGNYMLFVMDANGVPSESELIQVPALSKITWPTEGYTLTGDQNTVYFRPGDAPIDEWRMTVGSSRGAEDIYDSGIKNFNESPWLHSIGQVPASGEKVYLRFWQRVNGGQWATLDTMYRTSPPPPSEADLASITWPPEGYVISDDANTIYFRPGPSTFDEWRMTTGTELGSQNLFDSGIKNLLLNPWEQSIQQIPADGSSLYLRFWQRNFNGQWTTFDTVYATESGEPPVEPGIEIVLQAEDQMWQNATVDNNHSGYTGTGFVNTANATGTWFELAVDAPVAANYEVIIRYSSGTNESRRQRVLINGATAISTFAMPYTGGWSNWGEVSFTVNLNEGSNTIRLVSLSPNGAPNLDRFTLIGEEPTEPPVNPDQIAKVTWPTPEWVLFGDTNVIYFRPGEAAFDEWRMTVGTQPGLLDIYDSGPKSLLDNPWEHDIGTMPATGEPVYLRFWQRTLNGSWLTFDVQYSTLGF